MKRFLDQPRDQGLGLLREASDCWYAMSEFRKERRRNKRYTYGDQWGDMVTVDGVEMSEAQYIRSQGNIPLKNNLIRRLVRNVLGVYRDNWKTPSWPFGGEKGKIEAMQSLLDRNAGENELGELYARSLEEFLISGVAIHRKSLGRRGTVNTKIVQPDNFFIDTKMIDVRCNDVRIVGEIHDTGFEDLCRMFACSADECRELAVLYGFCGDSGAPSAQLGGDMRGGNDFLNPIAGDTCRVVEVWRLENRAFLLCHDRIRGRLYKIPAPRCVPAAEGMDMHWRMEQVWCYYYLSPDGCVLKSGVTPYRHGSHPYIFRAYPFIDGEIHSFVSDIIDQQRYANRLITLYDWVMRASAKGVLLFPEDALPPGVDIDDISSEWSRFNGVILFRPKPDSPLPQQVSANAANVGITELLNIQLKLLEDISGVNGALQGNVASNSMSGKLFAAQTQNALTSLSDILTSYRSFERACTLKEASLLSEDDV